MRDILLLVQGVDGSGSLLLAGEGNEAESTGSAGLAVAHDDGISDLAELAEGGTESVIRGVPGQVSAENFRSARLPLIQSFLATKRQGLGEDRGREGETNPT